MAKNRQAKVLAMSTRQAARMLTRAMAQIHDGIENAAAAAGKLEACLDNDNQVETLSSPRADRTYQLFGQLTAAYNELAEHLQQFGG